MSRGDLGLVLIALSESNPLSTSDKVKHSTLSAKWTLEVLGIGPALVVVEVGIDLDDPFGLPLPIWRQFDTVLRHSGSTVLIRPVGSLVREKHVLKHTHPVSLVLVDLELVLLTRQSHVV